MGKSLKNILYAFPLIVLTSFIYGCEKGDNEPDKVIDKTPLEIEIISPKEQSNYIGQRMINVKWKIKDENGDFKEAYISFNGGGKIPLYSKEGSMDWYFKKDNNKILISAQDIHGNNSKDSTSFYIAELLGPTTPK